MILIYLLLALLAFTPPAWGAEVKITEFPADATPTGDDLLMTVDDPAGTPTSKKATITNVVGAVNALTATALANNGANCSAGSFPLGVDASGAAESCTDAATQAELDAHESDTTSVHGISDTSALETTTGAQTKVDSHVNDTTDAHNITAITNGVGATSAFGTDESCVRSDSTGRLVQASGTNCTIDDSGNITAASIKTGSGTSSLDGTAGAIELGQGTAPSGLGTNSIQIVAPTGVTSYRVVLPTAAATGFLKLTNSANTLTGTIEAAGGGGSGVIYIPAGSASVDGTFCTISRQQQNSGPFKDVMRCADNASGRFDITINTKGMGYAGATITLTAHWYHATSETITWASDISMQCRGTGDVINSTYSTPAALDISVTTVDVTEKQETTLAAHTPDGTCADGDEINIKGIIDATTMSANAANTQIIGWTIDLGL